MFFSQRKNEIWQYITIHLFRFSRQVVFFVERGPKSLNKKLVLMMTRQESKRQILVFFIETTSDRDFSFIAVANRFSRFSQLFCSWHFFRYAHLYSHTDTPEIQVTRATFSSLAIVLNCFKLTIKILLLSCLSFDETWTIFTGLLFLQVARQM